jgi:hypothetical protein
MRSTGWLAAAVLCIAACRPAGQSEVPADGYRLRYSPATLEGATCKLRLVVALRSTSVPLNVATEYVFTPSVADREVQLRVERITTDKQLGGVVFRDRVTPELIETTKKGDRVVRRAKDDAAARATIEALTARPHAFVRMDEHAGILDYHEDWGPGLESHGVQGLGLNWALGVPHLPVESVRPGAEWLGQRHLAVGEIDVESGVPLRYRLVRVRNGIATIGIESKKYRARISTKKGEADAVVTIEGEARVRVADGSFVDSDVDMTLTATLPTKSFEWRSSYVGSCER